LHNNGNTVSYYWNTATIYSYALQVPGIFESSAFAR